MTPRELAISRSRGYGLIARLLVRGPTPELIAQLPPGLLPGGADGADGADGAASDALAASWYETFHLEVFPYASVFLEPTPEPGGERSADASSDLRAAGFMAEAEGLAADHLGHLLGGLAFLCGAEADALEDGARDEDAVAALARVQAHQRILLTRHLRPWLPPLRQALGALPPSLWAELVELADEMTEAQLGELGPAPGDAGVAAPPALLDEPKTGLKEIARYLLTPCWSGLFLTRAELVALGRAGGLPRGFGGRLQMLTNLLRSAAEYGELPGLLARLDAILGARADAPAPWSERIVVTRALLAEVSGAAERFAADVASTAAEPRPLPER